MERKVGEVGKRPTPVACAPKPALGCESPWAISHAACPGPEVPIYIARDDLWVRCSCACHLVDPSAGEDAELTVMSDEGLNPDMETPRTEGFIQSVRELRTALMDHGLFPRVE